MGTKLRKLLWIVLLIAGCGAPDRSGSPSAAAPPSKPAPAAVTFVTSLPDALAAARRRNQRVFADVERLLSFAYARRPVPAAPSAGEITSPVDGAVLAAGEHEIRWQAEPHGEPVLRLLVLAYDVDRGWPGLDLKVLPMDVDCGSVSSSIQTITSARLWSVAADGSISDSAVSTWTIKPADPLE